MSLSDTAIRKAKSADRPVRLFDGGGLYVEVSPSGGKLWRLKYRFDGKEKRLALGIYPEVSLAKARERRDDGVRYKDRDNRAWLSGYGAHDTARRITPEAGSDRTPASLCGTRLLGNRVRPHQVLEGTAGNDASYGRTIWTSSRRAQT